MRHGYVSQTVIALAMACFSGAIAGCASSKTYKAQPPVTEENDRQNIDRPKSNRLSLYEDVVDKVFVQELDDFVNIPRHIRNLTNNQKEAKNLNTLDEVPNSSWFTNRNSLSQMSIEEIKLGANRGPGPDISAPLTVIAAKVEGVTPGFTVRDRLGDTYLIKFDPAGYPQLTTGAEVISTKLVYACGYNTPENYLSVFDPKNMIIGEGVFIRDRWGKMIPMTPEYVRKVLTKAHANSDGTYRVLASKFIEGKIIGPFQYQNVRKDDPNDRIPHHHRRELRGYKLIAAWLNNSDSKANNTLDAYVTENDRSFVKHYIIDFGASLGSAGAGPSARSRGHEGGFDVGKMLAKIFSLGLWLQPWEKQPRLINPTIGYFESKLFDPSDYKFIIPNPAFQKATNRDLFWAAKIIMSFTDEQIRAVVATGEYAKAEDEEYMARTLIERRDKIGRYWYSKINPLDRFDILAESNGGWSLQFVDLATKASFGGAGQPVYRYRVSHNGKALTKVASMRRPSLPLNVDLEAAANTAGKASGSNTPAPVFEVSIESQRRVQGSWSKPTTVLLSSPLGRDTPPRVLAVERQG